MPPGLPMFRCFAPKPNARWRDGFSLVPSIPVGCADKREVGALIQTGIFLLIMDFVFLLISLVVWLTIVKRKN